MTKARIDTILAAAIAVGATLVATAAPADQLMNGPALPARPAAPAADGGLGMAIFGAHVQTDGTIISGSGVVSAAKLATGQYEVIFNRNVTICAYNAVSFSGTVAEFAQPRSGNVNGMFVVFSTLGTTSTSPTFADSQFYVTVYCGS